MDQTGAGSSSTPLVYIYADGTAAASTYIKFVQIYNSNTTAGAQGFAIYDSTASTTNLLGYSFANNGSYFEHSLYLYPQVLATSNTTQQSSNKITSTASAWCGAGAAALPQYTDYLILGSGTNPTMTRTMGWTPGTCTGAFNVDYSSASGGFKAAGLIGGGTTFTTNGGCSENTLTGGATTGRVTSGTTGICTFTVTMGGGITSTHGWECAVHDRTTPADVINESGVGTSSTVIFTGTTVSGDVLSFSCVGIQ
jgi:hypothetical protein